MYSFAVTLGQKLEIPIVLEENSGGQRLLANCRLLTILPLVNMSGDT